MRLLKVPSSVLRVMAADEAESTSLPYRHSSWIVRELFWSRLQCMLNLFPSLPGQGKVLDLGGGSGIFLPTLSRAFRHVVCLDRFVDEAQAIVDRYELANVTLIEANLLRSGLKDDSFDVVVAADVLEHIKPLDEALQEIYRLARKAFFVSGPTENLFYRLGRPVFGFQKPKDHYYTYRQVEDSIVRAGFRLEQRRFVPVNLGEAFSAFGVAHFEK